jgi:hypothetical protein
MSNSRPAIPSRGSSLAALEERRIKHAVSKTDLKRKLSDKSLEEGIEKHIKLRIEDVELNKEELLIENQRLDLEKQDNRIDHRVYQKAKKENNKRIISLGDDLWSERRKLRKIQEDTGKISLLTPDSDNAFAAALLRLYKDPKMSRKRQSAIQSALQADTIMAYGAAPSQENQDYKGFVRCALTGEFSRAFKVKTAPIVPYFLREELACYIFGAGQGLRLNRPENCLMMNRDIEQAWNNGNITLFPVDPTTRLVLRWKIILVNQDARNEVLDMKTVERVGDLDGKEITFLTEQRPASRLLYYHFVMSLLLCRARGNPGWEALWLQYGKTEPWSTPRRYMRQSMLAALSRCVGIVDDVDFEKLVNGHSFASATGLNGEDEDEIARRVVELFEENSAKMKKMKQWRRKRMTQSVRLRTMNETEICYSSIVPVSVPVSVLFH